MKTDYDRWFVIQDYGYEGLEVTEFDRAGEAQGYIQERLRYSPANLFRVIYGREFDIKVTETEVEKVTKLEFE